MLRVLQLTGSAVSDFHADLSLLYARDCLAATTDPGRYDMQLAFVTPDGRWRFPTGLDTVAIAAATPMHVAEAVARICALAPDVMVPQMFCLPGMTSYRGLFDVLSICYIGNRPEVMALTANKARARAVVASAGVAVPDGELLSAGQKPTLDPPTVVKPVDADNSAGITLVRDRADYPGALEAAFEHADAALVERYVELGREVRCGVVVRNGELVCLPLEEYAVDGVHKPIRGADDKPRGSGDDLELVAKDGAHAWIVDPQDPITQSVWETAGRCHLALGCRHYSLFDFRIDPAGTVWFLEASLYSSFARQSVLTTMAAAAGLPVDELFALALRESIGPTLTKGR